MSKIQHVTGAICAGILTLSLTTPVNAALLGRLPATPGGTDYQAYYDPILDITWLADANLAASNTFGLAYNTDLGKHPADSSYFSYYNQIQTDGRMTWSAALHWIDAMNADGGTGYLGFNDWRLPDMVPCLGFDCPDSEMGYLYYTILGASPLSSILNASNAAELAKFSNVQSYGYWSGVETVGEGGSDYVFAWYLNTLSGLHEYRSKRYPLYVWAVRSGDVSAVPVPAAVWLFGSGLIALLGVTRRRAVCAPPVRHGPYSS